MAYNQGDVEAAEKAMWKNHAVTRPNGVTLDRDHLLAQWKKEWETLGNRKLSYKVREVSDVNGLTVATWSVEATGDATYPDGTTHAFHLVGTQHAGFKQQAGDEMLDGPIIFLDATQTMDGQPWAPPS